MSSSEGKSSNWFTITISILLVISLFIILGMAYNQYQQNQAINESIDAVNESVNSLKQTVNDNEAQRQADINSQKNEAQAATDNTDSTTTDNSMSDSTAN